MAKQVLINVSNRLPVTLLEDGGIKKSSGGLVTALEGLGGEGYALEWLGWPGKEVPGERQAEVARELETEHGCVPVFLPQALAEAHYEGLANASIWPLLHYLPDFFRYEEGWWEAYERVNRTFAEQVLARVGDREDGALVWVHDYQLMLLPRMLKEARPGLRVGFFLHTPFPSSEVFRCHPRREELLAGVLGADLVGFHTFGFLRHFRSSVLRLLGIGSEITTVRGGAGRETRLGVYPIGIPAEKFAAQVRGEGHAQQLARTLADLGGKRLILSVERLDYTKGILQKLESAEIFLKRITKEERDGVKFMFVAVPSREGIDEYQDLRAQIESAVGRVNGAYATLHNSPVHFIYGSVAFDELCALYAAADVCTVTPVRDGMNLVAKEFIACQPEGDEGARAPGVLILSEFAGAAEELLGAVVVNPYDVPGVATAIADALKMPANERGERMGAMRRRVMTYDAKAWADEFVGDLARTTKGPGQVEQDGAELARRVAEELKPVLTEDGSRDERAALFLDYDGTLREIVADPAMAGPTAEIRALLDRLAAVVRGGRADVTIVSGRTPADLGRFLAGYDGFTLVAEHGAAMRPAGSGAWGRADAGVSYDWKPAVLEILRLYERQTPGSHVEEKRTGAVWHYRRADPELGEWKARALAEALGAVTANAPVEVRLGRCIVEVAPVQVSKGAAIARLLAERRYAAVLIAGDDTTDESMFRAARDVPAIAALSPITVRVGAGETAARYRVGSPRALRGLLMHAMG